MVKVMRIFRSVIMTFDEEMLFRDAVAAALPAITERVSGEAEVAAAFDLAAVLARQECVVKRALHVMNQEPLVATLAV
jgi:hypothetical protein